MFEHVFQVPKYHLMMVNDYLKDYSLLYEIMKRERKTAVMAGVVQGSILRSDLWNKSYDSLLRIELHKKSLLVGYADDMAA